VKEGIRKSKDLGGGDMRQYHLTRRLYLERLKNLFLGGGAVLFRLLGSRLGPLEYNRVELTTFAGRAKWEVNHNWFMEVRSGT
jgi:hypothetical protein